MSNTKISIFTPTYNRGKLFDRLYNSLVNQTFKNFEWIIVDDGSTDNTKDIIDSLIKKSEIVIKYYYKNNGGKHTAINYGVKKAEGELFFIVDSDDYLTKDSLEMVWKSWSDIPESEKSSFAGVGGLRGYSDTKIIGKGFNLDCFDATTLELRYKLRFKGDKAEVFRTELLKSYMFPEYKGEKFVTEALIWNRIASDGYKLRWFNKIIYIGEYLDDGLTKKYEKLMINNWNATYQYYIELVRYDIPFIEKVNYGYAELFKYALINGVKTNEVFKSVKSRFMAVLSLPIAYYYFVKYRVKKIIKKVLRYSR